MSNRSLTSSSVREVFGETSNVLQGWMKIPGCCPETIYVDSDGDEGDADASRRQFVGDEGKSVSNMSVSATVDSEVNFVAGSDDFAGSTEKMLKSKSSLKTSSDGMKKVKRGQRLVRQASSSVEEDFDEILEIPSPNYESLGAVVVEEGVGESLEVSQEEYKSFDESSECELDTEFDNVLKQCQGYSNKFNDLFEKRLVSERMSKAAVGMEQQPRALKHNLKNYQLIGLNWLYLLHTEGLSGILADEMGLGKTVQTISLLTLLKQKGYRSLHMIVVPASTINNWRRELAHWSQSLEVLLYYGSQSERAEHRLSITKNKSKFQCGYASREYEFDVLLTTFQTATGKADRNFLRKIEFEYLVVDEAQMLKGNETTRYEILSKFKSRYRLLLTGTPLQNNLDELVSLLQFLMPNFFSNLKNNKMIREVRELLKQRRKIAESEYVQKMKDILEPFILRRLKSEVGIELVPKKHKVVHIKMPEVQRRVYEDIFCSTKKFLEDKVGGSDVLSVVEEEEQVGKMLEEDGDKKCKVKKWHSKKLATTLGFMNNMLMQMRKVSNHPVFVRSFYSEEALLELAKDAAKSDPEFSKLSLKEILSDFSFLSDLQLHYRASDKPHLHHLKLTDEQLFYSSGKMLVLVKLLPHLQKQGHRITMFSQFTTVLDMMELFLTQVMNVKYLRLDGSTPVIERQSIIDTFNTQTSYFIMLLTTQAGGLGINLTSADTVIFHDISYNPQVDKQAEDRCHRIGQDKAVTVYILLTIGTVEDHMYSMAKAKTELNDLMLSEGKFAVTENASNKAKVSMHRNLAQRMFLESQLSFEEKDEWLINDEEGLELYITSVD